MKIAATLLAMASANLSERLNYESEEEAGLKRIRELCPCADSALEGMALAMYQYQDDQRNNPGKTSVDDLVKQIKSIAHECTARPECRCPEGYFKTRDGTECLKFSEEEANCIDAERACSADFNSRLAIAKDQERLDKIATIMDEIGSPEDYYWIGLSYNKTNADGAEWRWSDGNKASGDMVNDLNNQLKKSRANTYTLDIDIGDGLPIERVAVSSQYHGKVWKHESCRARGLTGPPKHKYICEFMMFKVRINAETKTGGFVGKIGEF